MVFSNEEMLRRKNIDASIQPDGMSIHSNLDWEKHFTVVDATQRLDDYFAESYYNDKSFEDKYKVKKEIFDAELKRQIYAVGLRKQENQQVLADALHETMEIKGKSLLDNEQIHQLAYVYLGYAPAEILGVVRLMLLLDADKAKAVRVFKKLIQLSFVEVLQKTADSDTKLPFNILKREYLAKCENIEEKLDILLRYLYEELGNFDGNIEKEAVDYFVKRSSFVSVYQDSVTEQEVDKVRKPTYKWLKAHNKPKNFLELQAAPIAEEKLRLVSQLLGAMGYSTFFTENFNLEQRQVQALMAILDKNASAYNNDPESKNLLLYFCVAVHNIIEQLRAYSNSYINLSLQSEYREIEYAEKIKKAEQESAPLKKLLKERQSALNSMQLELDRMKNKELARLKEELEFQKELHKELEAKIASLEEMNGILEAEIDEQDTEVETELTAAVKPNSYVGKRLRELNIVVMGGHQIWQNRLKEIYPYFTFIDAENVNYDINITRNADFIFFNTLHCSHTLFYRVKANVNNGRKNNKEKLIFIGSNNLANFKEIVERAVAKG